MKNKPDFTVLSLLLYTPVERLVFKGNAGRLLARETPEPLKRGEMPSQSIAGKCGEVSVLICRSWASAHGLPQVRS